MDSSLSGLSLAELLALAAEVGEPAEVGSAAAAELSSLSLAGLFAAAAAVGSAAE